MFWGLELGCRATTTPKRASEWRPLGPYRVFLLLPAVVDQVVGLLVMVWGWRRRAEVLPAWG